MTSIAWFCAGFGLAISVVLAVAILVDILFLNVGEPTISQRCLAVGDRWPIVAVLITAVLAAPVFILIGHLFFAQKP